MKAPLALLASLALSLAAAPTISLAGDSFKGSKPLRASCERPKLVSKCEISRRSYVRHGCDRRGNVVRYKWVVVTYRATFTSGVTRKFSETHKVDL